MFTYSITKQISLEYNVTDLGLIRESIERVNDYIKVFPPTQPSVT